MSKLLLVNIDSNKSTNTITDVLIKELITYGYKVKISDLSDKEVCDADLVIGLHSNSSGDVLIIKDDTPFSKSGRLAYIVSEHLLEYYNCTILSNKEIGRLFTFVFTQTKKIPTIILMYGSRKDKDNKAYASLLADAIKQLKSQL